MITFALPKGRIFDEIVPLLEAAGIAVTEDPSTSRKLIIGTSRADVRLVLVRASDVPTYVQYGGADLGHAGVALGAAVLQHQHAGLVDVQRVVVDAGVQVLNLVHHFIKN